MPGYTFAATAIQNKTVLGNMIIDALTNGGGTGWFSKVVDDITTPTHRFVILESTVFVDSYLSTNPDQTYRIILRFGLTSGEFNSCDLFYGDSDQLRPIDNDTNVSIHPNTPVMNVFTTSQGPSVNAEFSFRISITDRGFAMSTWAISRVNTVANNFMCVIQRPVNPTSGLPKVEGVAPIFALWRNIGGAANITWFNWGIVRERNNSTSILVGPTNTVGRQLFYKISMDWPTPTLFDNNTHVVKFPYGFSTFNYLYLDELDLVCIVNASGFATEQNVEITMYGEAEARKYRTSWGTLNYGQYAQNTGFIPQISSGARLGILIENGGISVEDEEVGEE